MPLCVVCKQSCINQEHLALLKHEPIDGCFAWGCQVHPIQNPVLRICSRHCAIIWVLENRQFEATLVRFMVHGDCCCGYDPH